MKDILDISVADNHLLQYEKILQDLFKEIPFAQIIAIQSDAHDPQASQNYHDIIVDVKAGVESWRLLIETKWTGEPRLARQACLSLLSTTQTQTNTYPVFAAPYIGSQSRQICKDLNVGFIDLSGNCRLIFGNVYISRENFPNVHIERRQIKSIFSSKTSRIIRTMLEEPKKYWHVVELAKAADVSLGLVSKVKQKLFNLEYVISDDSSFKLHNPELVLKNWSHEYSYKDNEILYCYSSAHVHENEQKLGNFCIEKNIQVALTLFSGAAWSAPSIHGTFPASIYVNANPKQIAQEMNWKAVPSGANVILLKPYDDYVLKYTQKIEKAWFPIVSDIQLYLDLSSYGGRGEDAAQFVLEQKLRPKWK
jgi:hypothetical protein